ncbi:MAG: hypothetical protein IPG57_04535 [Burkholderiales bacterium]|nr:hypothetical protein [Burkholderiales bacterium]
MPRGRRIDRSHALTLAFLLRWPGWCGQLGRAGRWCGSCRLAGGAAAVRLWALWRGASLTNLED